MTDSTFFINYAQYGVFRDVRISKAAILTSLNTPYFDCEDLYYPSVYLLFITSTRHSKAAILTSLNTPY
jgi:hypothetical protein